MIRVLRSEWTKFASLRSLWWTALSVIPFLGGLAVFVGMTESLQPDDTVLGGSLTGAVVGQVAVAVLGVLAVSGEYGSGMIRTTFTVTPSRAQVLGAKAAVAGAVELMSGLAAAVVAYGIGAYLLSGAGYAEGEPMPALLGVALCLAATAVLGAAVGALVRHPAGAIMTVVAFLMLPALLAPLFGDLQGWVSGASPQVVLQKMTQSSDVPAASAGSLDAWPSLGLLAAYAIILMTVATVWTSRRDA